MELPLTARSPRYARSFCARFWLCTNLKRSGVSSMNCGKMRSLKLELITIGATNSCPSFSSDEDIMGKKSEEERYISLRCCHQHDGRIGNAVLYLDTTDPEFY